MTAELKVKTHFLPPEQPSEVIYSQIPTRTPPLSGHQALDTLSLALFQEHDEGKYSPKIEDYNRLLTRNASSVTICFKIK